MEKVCIFYGHLEQFKAILNILWPFGDLVGNMVSIFSPVLGYCVEKNLATLAPKILRKFSSLPVTKWALNHKAKRIWAAGCQKMITFG
jgi:hypothetical protein